MFQFKVVEIIDNPDGSANVIFEIDHSIKEQVKQFYGWKRWSSKKFEQLFIEGLYNYIKERSNDGSI